jgi:hypothetical protein
VDILNALPDNLIGNCHGIPGHCKTPDGNLGAVLDEAPYRFIKGYEFVFNIAMGTHLATSL